MLVGIERVSVTTSTHRDPRPLSEIVEGVETRRKTARVRNFTGEDGDLAAIEEFFEPHAVDVVVESAEGPDDHVVLSTGSTVLATSPVSELMEYVRAWQESMSTGLTTPPPAVVEGLSDNYFESYDKGRMVMASRIVEFRAWNVGEGILHAGFQHLSNFEPQRSTYRNLTNTDVSVQLYGVPDGGRPGELGLTVHETGSEECLNHWWVAFDGNGADEDKVVLLAQEREANRFYGFWTYEATVVEDVLERMPALA